MKQDNILLDENGKVITCNNCNENAIEYWMNPYSYNTFPKCKKHLLEAIERVEEVENIEPFSGMNEFGEYYDENSY